jgi:hypoxanthine phosphoribosyltransferase
VNFDLEGSNPEIKESDLKRWDEERFAHRSEQEFARLLDFYDIKWLYEPVSFDIAWDQKGIPVSKFTPDFYLPEYDLYIEITTMNQKLVTKKNRKVKRLKQLYPEVNCKIFYRKDYRHLLFKYGINLEEP